MMGTGMLPCGENTQSVNNSLQSVRCCAVMLMQRVTKCLCTATIGTKYCGTSRQIVAPSEEQNWLHEGGVRITAHVRRLLRGMNLTALDRALLMAGRWALALHSQHLHLFPVAFLLYLHISFICFSFLSSFPSLLITHPASRCLIPGLGIVLK